MVTNEMQFQPAMLPEDAPPPLDMSVIEGLRALAGDGIDIVGELTGAFLDDGQDRLRKMHAAIANGDEATIRKAAHSLKGMSGSIGANYLSTLSFECEKAEPGGITVDRILLIEQEFHRVSAALKVA